MRTALALVACLAVVATGVTALEAVCHFRGGFRAGDEGIVGNVTFLLNTSTGLTDMTVNIQGLLWMPNDLHGIHIHEFGDLSGNNNGASFGSHYDGGYCTAVTPVSNCHGCQGVNASGSFQMGDTGNWQFTGGVASQTKQVNVSFTGSNSIIGRGIILHNMTDDCISWSSAAARLAGCVIGLPNDSKFNTTGGNDNNLPAVCQGMGANGMWTTVSVSSAGVTKAKANIGSYPATNPLGIHALHIHAYGDMSNGATSFAGHYDPFNMAHGVPPSATREVGDLGNFYYSANGTYYYQWTNDLLNTGAQSIIGRGCVIHELPDCNGSVAWGPRIIFGVIGVANTGTSNPNYPLTVPNNTPDNANGCPVTTTGTTGVAAVTTTGTTGVAAVTTTGVAASGSSNNDSSASVFGASVATVVMALALTA